VTDAADDAGSDSGPRDTGPVDTGPPPARPPRAGELVVSEIMVNPGGANQVSDDDAEWVEIANLAGQTLTLDGCALFDEGSEAAFAFPGGSRLEAGAYSVVGRSGDRARNGGVNVDHVTQALRLSNQEDSVTLRCGAGDLDVVRWRIGDWPVHTGAALSLDPSRMSPEANDSPDAWCPSVMAIRAAGDRGSPGIENPVCPPRMPATCADAVDASAGGLFGWDLALARAGRFADHAYIGECASPNADGPYDVGVGSADVVFRFGAPERRRWILDLWAVREGADLAMYVWEGYCPQWGGEACADDVREPDGQVRIDHAQIDRVLPGGKVYYVIVDGIDASVGEIDPQPFTLEVVRGDPVQ